MIRHILVVALGGAVGATARFLLSEWFAKNASSSFPVATLVVNVVGCFAIGIMTQVSLVAAISPELRLLLVTGLLGSLTTFSTFGLETIRCVHQHDVRMAILNVLANLVLGLLAVVLGLGLGRLIWRQ